MNVSETIERLKSDTQAVQLLDWLDKKECELDWLEIGACPESDCFSVVENIANNIDGYMFKYKESAQGSLGLDDKLHYGIMAQDLERTPLMQNTVDEIDGIKTVNTKELSTNNTAIIADMAKAIMVLKNEIDSLKEIIKGGIKW